MFLPAPGLGWGPPTATSPLRSCHKVQSNVLTKCVSFLQAYCIISSELIRETLDFPGFLCSYWEPFVSLHRNLISWELLSLWYMLTYNVKDAAINTVSWAAGRICRILWRLGRRHLNAFPLGTWGCLAWGFCASIPWRGWQHVSALCGVSVPTPVVRQEGALLLWEGSRRLVLLQFQIYPVGREVGQSLRQWEREYAAPAERGNCSWLWCFCNAC